MSYFVCFVLTISSGGVALKKEKALDTVRINPAPHCVFSLRSGWRSCVSNVQKYNTTKLVHYDLWGRRQLSPSSPPAPRYSMFLRVGSAPSVPLGLVIER